MDRARDAEPAMYLDLNAELVTRLHQASPTAEHRGIMLTPHGWAVLESDNFDARLLYPQALDAQDLADMLGDTELTDDAAADIARHLRTSDTRVLDELHHWADTPSETAVVVTEPDRDNAEWPASHCWRSTFRCWWFDHATARQLLTSTPDSTRGAGGITATRDLWVTASGRFVSRRQSTWVTPHTAWVEVEPETAAARLYDADPGHVLKLDHPPLLMRAVLQARALVDTVQGDDPDAATDEINNLTIAFMIAQILRPRQLAELGQVRSPQARALRELVGSAYGPFMPNEQPAGPR
ncbi:hypothetical protein [Kutzneria sp. 744]|uniref:hypothetical protein n=1 Tax=Kutzneria sp. (strain 744) TaxID=345341 RepID=UPI0012F77C32|nr:hypothetical protein [Kutzneria sp. 744]